MEQNAESRIRRLRKERKLSGIKVAEQLNITPQYYYDIEKGERRLTAEIAASLADVLQTTVDYLLGKTDINLYDWITSPSEEAQQVPKKVQQTKETPASYENEKEFLSKIDLSDEELMQRFKVMVDGRELTEKEWKKLLAFLRMERELD
ncbi:helix-turn-helix transcriptional regulator [Brevibacillus borstelensis]